MPSQRPIRIVTDSAADLPLDLAQELQITIVPLSVLFDQEMVQETELSHDEFWTRVGASAEPPRTSQPPLGAFEMAFRQLVDQGYQVICTTLTSRHSGTFSAAWAAAQAFGDRVVVLDSESLSMGMGYQVIEAARMALNGATLQAILGRMQSLRERSHVFIHIETLEHLSRGGRAAALMPAINRLTRTLNLRPLLNVIKGEIRLLSVVRSTQKSIHRIRDQIQTLGPLEHLLVMHIRACQRAEELADELAQVTGMAREQIFIGEAGAVLACHGGAGVVAAAAWPNEKEQDE